MPHTVKVFGPPGTGKTYWMLNKLQDEIASGTDVRRIAYVTFSRAAREEAMGRAKLRMDSLDEASFQYFKTIHGICFSEINMSKAHVMGAADFLKFARYCPVEFSTNYTEEYSLDGYPLGWSNSPGNHIMNLRQVASARRTSPFDPDVIQDHWLPETRHNEVKHVLGLYQKFKEQEAKFDFVDMLEIYEQSGDPLPIDVMFVDEAQDLSRLQWALVHKMCARAKRLYIAGDDDQSIYGFLGADPFGFLDHPCEEKVFLRQSYRLRRVIWDYANRVISRVERREAKTVDVTSGGALQRWGMRYGPERVLAGLDLKSVRDVMIIGSTNYQLSRVRGDLEKWGIPVSYKGKSLTSGEDATRFYWYHKARKGADVPITAAVSLVRSLKLPPAKALADESRIQPNRTVSAGELGGMGVKFIANASSIDYLSGTARSRAINNALYSMAARNGLEALIEQPKVSLQTFHSCKGREADHTIIMTDSSPRAMEYDYRNPDYGQRLAYVGLTRARHQVNIIDHTTPHYMRGFKYA
jgi:superfamily I DNA/RNA helicase